VRLLTILDIFDALTARDRPYKPAMPTEKALAILGEMAAEGKLDREILLLFEAYRPWAPATEDAE
jgi:HD-GYP domain-containing protein (c-di-GMP phosphodiesterase class II)